MYNFSKKSISKIVCIFLINSLLICTCSIGSFASGADGWNSNEFTYVVDRTDRQNVSSDITSQCTITYNATQYGVTCTKIQTPYGAVKDDLLLAYKWKSLNNAEYKFRASFFCNFSSKASLEILLRVRVNNTIVKTQTLYYVTPMSTINNDWIHLDFNFTPDLDGITGGYDTEFLVRIHSNQESANTTTVFGVANDIYLQATNDNSTLLGGILVWLNTLYYSIVGGTDSSGNYHTGIVQGIQSGLTSLGNSLVSNITSLGNNISTWLTGVKDGIVNKLQNVQTAITNAIDGIEQWFIDLGNDIGDFFTMLKNYILYFQHPVTLNADGVPVDGNGNPVYTNPFDDTLDSVSDTLDDWFDSLDDFILTIQSVNVQITGYLQTFTNIFNRFNAGVPIIGVIITLALIVIVIKKIMGR